MAANSIKITDTTFRDAHQSLLATRLRTSDMEPIVPEMDSVGFHSMEVWGGATFDVATRYLAEDPWERLRSLKSLMPNTPLMMLLRGQNLVGYRGYADDVVQAFVQRAAEVGIDIFRVFDALNDERNLETAAKAVKKCGKHLQIAICYSVGEEGRLGGPIFNAQYFIEKALRFQDMDADSICLKDMGGLMAPYDAHELVVSIKRKLKIPLQLHTHYTSGMASMTVLKAIEAGVDAVDACLAPLALRTSQPAVEPLVVTLMGTERASNLDLKKLLGIGDYLESILPRYREYMQSPHAAVIDAKVLSHQIPGGMTSNLIAQLREANAIDRLDEVLSEVPKTRKELGYPPMVTPMSQIVGHQSVSNVLFGRYKMMSDQVKDYAFGLYGRPPVPIDHELVEMALKDYRHGQRPTTKRPADLIEPELERAREAIKDISDNIEDVLTYALYPTTGLRFLRIKYGLEPVPEEMKSVAHRRVKEPAPRTAPPSPIIRKSIEPQSKSHRARHFNVFVEDKRYEVEVDPVPPRPYKATFRPEQRPSKPLPTAAVRAQKSTSADVRTIVAPMPGILLRYEVVVGQRVKIGDPVVVLETMKMENTLPAPIAGEIDSLPIEEGITVATNDVLAIIAP